MSPRGQKSKATAGRETWKDGWAGLTWDDLDRWAGPRSVARGRSYERQGRVGDLAVGDDGRLLATVRGGDRYVVSVWLVGGKKKSASKIESHCTCPVGYDCKHAVATVAAYLQALADKTAVPKADPDDPRWKNLAATEEEFDDDLNEWDDDEEFDDDLAEGVDDEIEDEVEEEAKAAPPSKERSRRRTTADWNRKIREMVCGKSREELAELVLSLIGRFPELNEEFRERIALSEGDVKRLVGQARRELQAISSEPAWRNSWTGEGNTPDYSRLKHRLERLLELGHADAIVELGREFVSSAMRQVAESHDEGETATEVADCLPVVFDAVVKSSLPAPEKVLFAIDACLADEYDVVHDSAGKLVGAKWSADDWSAVADKLAARLKAEARRADDDAGDDFSRNYRRDRVTNWLATALKNAGRQSEIRAIYEAEVRRSGSYERLVRFLIEQRQTDDAERWAREGIEKTRAKLPGIAGSLARLLCDVAARRKRWDVVAAHAAVEFLNHPSQRGFNELMAHAKKAKCEESVRKAALRFLETGDSPVKIVQSKKEGAAVRVDPSWPLPVPDYLAPLLADDSRVYRTTGPHYDVLLDMAITAKRPEDVLHWYDKMTAGRKSASLAWGGYGAHDGAANRVAEAVARSHPERALEIYRRGLDAALPHANMASYESATVYLRKMRPIMDALGRKQEWSDLLGTVREKYRNRPRFMELLDNLEGRTILAAKKVRRR